ncbi:hypothetical protein NCG97_00240 [Streptomyces lydicamycinicus]|uniref:hypothetical protein n=1 Tax=Streptomyces lydicamycinicus TaxID=1546107 RepID=UPI002035B4AC|nr:hypothetical protein [Streptomyces lydicamycinicus]URZ99452.1 hypothetical protein NCG97_00240 [Streptomyces lydicamycinicus]
MFLDLLHALLDPAARAVPDGGAPALLADPTRAVPAVTTLVQLLRRSDRRRSRRVVEPGMTITTSGVAAAGIKATGSVTSALIGRYRPTGVPRLGSKEDRVEAYRRLLDASTRSFNYAYQFSHLQREAGRAAHKLLLGQLPQAWEVSGELIGALHGVRLCGTVLVIAAAEDLVAATSDLELNEKDGERFQRQAEAVVAAQGAFLDTCREDLSYATKWWQLVRRYKERSFLQQQADR